MKIPVGKILGAMMDIIAPVIATALAERLSRTKKVEEERKRPERDEGRLGQE